MRLESFFEKFEMFADAPNAVAKMRELVLELAVQGRLVPQHAKEGTAHALLERVASTAKSRGRDAGESEDTDAPFPIPESWAWVRLPRVLKKLTDGTHHSPPNGQSGAFMYVTAKNIKTDGVLLDGITYVSKEVHDEIYSRCDPSFGDVLYIKDGATTGIATINQVKEPFSMLSSVALLKPSEAIFNRYLLWAMRSPFFYAETRGAMKGAAITRVTLSVMAASLLPLPPLAEQKRIVAKVDELMALCDRMAMQQQERETRHAALARASLARFSDAPAPANLEFLFHKSYEVITTDLRKTILTLAVQGKLVPQDPDDEPASELVERLSRELSPEDRRRQAAPVSPLPADSLQYELPDNWTWAQFRDVAIIASNLVNPNGFLDLTHLAPDNIEKGNGVLLPCATVREDKVISSNHQFYPGQIVYSKIRPNLAKVVVVDFEGLCSADMYPIDALIDAFFLQRYMLSESFLVQAVKTDTRVAMPKINQMELNAIAVPVPPLAEQRRIVAKVDQLMALVDQLETQLAASRATAANLLSALVAELTAA